MRHTEVMWSRSWIHCSWQCGCLALVRKSCMLHSPILSYTGMCRCVCVSPAVPSDPHSCSGKTRRKLSHADCRLSLKFHELEQEEPKKKSTSTCMTNRLNTTHSHGQKQVVRCLFVAGTSHALFYGGTVPSHTAYLPLKSRSFSI